MTGESDDLKRLRPFLLRPAGFADAGGGDADNPGGDGRAGVGAADAAAALVILGVVATAVGSVIVDCGTEGIVDAGVTDEMETIAGSFHNV